MSRHFHKSGQKLGLIWIDAHADMNTPDSSPSGNVHGMPLACAMGLGPEELTHLAGYSPSVDPKNVAIVGLRSVDDIERLNVREMGVHPFTMRDIDECGMRHVMAEAIRYASEGTAGFHLSFDMDAVDPSEAPGVGTPVHGGITYREAHLAVEMICDTGRMTSMEVVEVNPVLDIANRTALLGVELVTSAMGKRIL
jgi:arginase